MKKYLSLLILLLISNFAAANPYVGSSHTQISFITSYNHFGSGDVMFKIKDPIAECTGYYISNTDAGYNSNLSMIIAAFQAKTTVKIYGVPEIKWSGSSSGHYCKTYSVEYHE